MGTKRQGKAIASTGGGGGGLTGAVAPLTTSGSNVTTSIATNTIVGRTSAGTGVMQALTPAQVNTMLGVGGYNVYTALITQTGTNAPVAVILKNTLGGVPVWSYDSVGSYLLTLAGVFLDGKVWAQGGLIDTTPNFFVFSRLSDNQMALGAVSIAGTPSDDIISNPLAIEIRIYP